MDADGSGELSRDELHTGYAENEAFRDAFEEMDIVAEDLDIVWTILDSDKSGSVSYAEFIKEVYKLKDSDSTFMLAYIKYYITIIKNTLIDELKESKKQILEEDHKIEAQEESLQRIVAEDEVQIAHLLEKEAGRQASATAEPKEYVPSSSSFPTNGHTLDGELSLSLELLNATLQQFQTEQREDMSEL